MSANPVVTTSGEAAAAEVTSTARADRPSLLRRAARRVIYWLLPRPAWATLRFELHMARVRVASGSARRRFRGADNLLVNLGAGTMGKAGWINVDAFAFPGINCTYDMRHGLPFADGSVRGIFCEHFFEHIDYDEEAPVLLRECHRVLKPGGVVRLIVPDAGAYLRAYCEEGWESLTRIRPLKPGRVDFYFGNHYDSKMEAVNVVFRQGTEHKYAYDAETLLNLLRRCGFARVERQAFGQSLMQEICLDQPMRESESLYVEAVKE
jgi:predicted SAM-dependent methyltransferase